MDLKYTITRRPRRRTLSIVIAHDNRIVVRANQSMPDKAIVKFIESKRDWISKTLNFNNACLSLYTPKQFICGEKFMYLGEDFSLLIERGKNRKPELKEGIFVIRIPKHIKNSVDYGRDKLVQWYRTQSYQILNERVDLYRRILNVQIKNIKIRSLKSTWANCSCLGVLTFSWRLIMAPLNIVDYVVVHELAHRLQHNHSARFWKQVEKTIPEYKACKKWLRDNERRFRW